MSPTATECIKRPLNFRTPAIAGYRLKTKENFLQTRFGESFFANKKQKSKKRLILRQNNLKIPFFYVKFQTNYINKNKLNKKKRFVGKKHLRFRLFLVQKPTF